MKNDQNDLISALKMYTGVIEEENKELRSEKAYLFKFSEDNMKSGNGPEGTLNIGPRKKTGMDTALKVPGMGYNV